MNSILEKIIESQEKQQAASVNPTELVSALLKNLSSKESDIISRRFGILGKDRETLEQIGKYYNITRERIRQVELSTIKKLKDLKDFRTQIESAEQHISRLLENYGGIMEEEFLLSQISPDTKKDHSHNQSARFILSHLLDDKIDLVKADSELMGGWKLPITSVDLVKQVINELVEIIQKEEKILKTDDLIANFKDGEFYKNNKDLIAGLKLGASDQEIDTEIEKLINSYLIISKKINQNILGEWGLSTWNIISPKRMSDKVYLVLRKLGKPLHFTEITDMINQSGFDSKTAYPATIHNELILDNRYVLVGRGIYALQEWGYKTGTVIDIITEILKNTDRPLSKDEIIKKVLDQRIVRKSTIYLALTNKEKIKKLPDNTYSLVQL